MNIILIIPFLIPLIIETSASNGDDSRYFISCVDKCTITKCEDDGEDFINTEKQSTHMRLLQWSCINECEYKCMWDTVDAFHKRGFATPQFFGKWPFIRLWGIQEPASMVFSIFNFYVHLKSFLQFRKEVRNDSPFYWFWQLYSLVSLNAWLWSAVFHTRDFPQTEFLDYSCAFSMVLMFCYCMIMRILKDIPKFLKIIISVFFFAFFANHVAYLKIGRFDYSYNMQVNILVGLFSVLCWFAWCLYNRHRQPYVWKCAMYVALCGSSTLLEIIDKPPIFYVFDSHALWHLCTAPLTYIFYSFLQDDCKFLRQQAAADEDKVLKDN